MAIAQFLGLGNSLLLVTIKLIETLLVVIGSYVVIRIARRQIKNIGKRARMPRDIISLSCDVTKFVVYFIAFYLVLVLWNVTSIIMPLLAGAGVVALAIGLASKDIISNTISGIFILLDRPFRIGNIIEVRGVKGEVTKIGLRTTKIRMEDGTIVTIPNTILSNDIVKKIKVEKTK